MMQLINRRLLFIILVLSLGLSSCIKNPFKDEEPIVINFPVGSSAFVINEGGFGFGNASVDHINLVTGEYTSSIFQSANNRPLGDVLQDMVIVDGRAYMVLNNSSKIEVAELDSFNLVGTISGLESPRYMQFVALDKAYVTDFKANEIAIVNPQSFEKTGSIPLNGWTEEMTLLGNNLYVTNRDSDHIFVVDIIIDEVVDSIKLSYGTAAIERDNNGLLWVYCVGDEQQGIDGALYGIEPISKSVLDTFSFPVNSGLFPRMAYAPTISTLYIIQDGIRSLDVVSKEFASIPLVPGGQITPYGLEVDSRVGNIFVLDAKDYQQNGELTIYLPSGETLANFETGLIPNGVVFY